MATLISRILSTVALAGLVLVAVSPLLQVRGGDAARPGAPSPAFAAQDIAGRTVHLGDFVGKTIILEWTNNGCPWKPCNPWMSIGPSFSFRTSSRTWTT